MAVNWVSSLEVGVDEIDAQHKRLFEQVDRLVESVRSGAGEEESKRTLDFLGKYVVEHFAAEERYMDRYGYPKSAEHKKQHADLIEYYKATRAKVDREGASLTLMIQLQRHLVDWLNHHIFRSDRELGAFLKTKL